MNKKSTNLNELAENFNFIKKEDKPSKNELKNLLVDWLPNEKKCTLRMPGTDARVPLIFKSNAHGCSLVTAGKHYVRIKEGYDKPIPIHNQIKEFPAVEIVEKTEIYHRSQFEDREELLGYISRGKIFISKE